tara:strand:- start:390 stop:1172 length:783 start_codon:yes stop_codon:yes gene_type:complete
MPNTTNFNWVTPADTDLVKDGALAIRTLGNGIDTSFLDLKGGTTDQVLAKNSNTDLDFKWVAQDDSNAIQNAIVDAKGDLISATAADTPARLAVGANGTVLTADSAETTGLKWAAPSGASFVGASAYRSTTLSLTADTVVIVTYANESYDTSGFHSTSADTSRMTVPSGKAGKYLCIANMFATGGSSRMIIYPYKNGSNVGGSPNWSYVIDNRGYGNAGAMTGSWVMDLAVADYVEVGLYSATNNATLQESTFQFIYLGA